MSEPTISLLQASQKLKVSYKILSKYQQQNLIQVINVSTNPQHFIKGLTIKEFERIQKLLTPKPNTMTAKQFANQNHFSTTTLQYLIKKLDLKPIQRYQKDAITPFPNYYAMQDLKKINQYLLNKRQHVKHLNLIPNTDHIFNPKNDITVQKLCNQLKPDKPVTARIIFQWIKYHRIDGNYSVDTNGKLFFTIEQAQNIKNQYRKLPDDLFGIHSELAQKLNITPQNLTIFRKFYKLPSHKVLGYKEIFYTNADAKKIIDWYQNKQHRPYPYSITKAKEA